MFDIRVDSNALQDIQDATDWYNEHSPGLGSLFLKQVKNQINSLKSRPFVYPVRYSEVRCMLIKKFPFIVHFTITENTVEVFAVFHTSRNPKIWKQRNDNLGH